MSEKLKPCPFCGGEAEIIVEGESGYENSWIQCIGCNSTSETVKAWNKRVQPKADVGKIKEILNYLLNCEFG